MASARIEHHTIATNSTQLHVAMTGEGPPVVLLHGWPHTWQVWSEVIPELAESHRVIAPDLRGLGDSTRAATGYDVSTLAADVLGLLDALDTSPAAVVGIDAGSPVAFMMAMRSPRRVARLVMMESLLGSLPGAEEFLTGGPPWWFGFHSVPGLAETVLVGHEADYVNWFLEQGTRGRGAPPTVRDANRRRLHRHRLPAVRIRLLPVRPDQQPEDHGGARPFPADRPDPGDRRRHGRRRTVPSAEPHSRRPDRAGDPGLRPHHPARPSTRPSGPPLPLPRRTGAPSRGC